MVDDPFEAPEERRARRRAEKKARAQLAQDNSVLQSLMGQPSGRSWMYELLGECGVFRTVVHQNPYFTYLNEGKRQVGLRLLSDVMRACPEAYIMMTQENADGRRNDKPGPVDTRDPDDERNYDEAGRWIGSGDHPDAEPDFNPAYVDPYAVPE